jgi:hypothetical protein
MLFVYIPIHVLLFYIVCMDSVSHGRHILPVNASIMHISHIRLTGGRESRETQLSGAILVTTDQNYGYACL